MTRRSIRALASGAIPAAAILVVLLLNLSPTLVYRVTHGADAAAFIRTPAQSEKGSLRVGDLLLPLSHHRIPALARLREDYSGRLLPPEFGSEDESATLGLVASGGLVWLALTLLAGPLGAASRWDPGGTFRAVALGAISASLFATVGGVAIAYVITPDIRQWLRLSIFIGFFSLLAVALLLDRVAGWVRGRRGGPITSAALLGAVGVLGFFDQTSSEFIPPYRPLGLHFKSDQAFVAAIEPRLPPRAAVLQLPYMPWPEPGFIHRMSSFAPVRGYLHAGSLRWSYGAMRGRPADWQSQLAGQPPAVIGAAAVAVGFDGIYIDRSGYAWAAAADLEDALERLFGSRPLVSADHRFSFFDARAYARLLRGALPPRGFVALRNATLFPVRLDAGAGAQAPPVPDFPTTGLGLHGPVRIRHRGELEAHTPSRAERTVIFTAHLSTIGFATAAATQFPDAPPLRLVVGSRPVAICRVLHIRGTTPIRFAVAGDNALRIDDARLTDAAYWPFVSARACGVSLGKAATSVFQGH
jgi:phosphoglycerol transferase